MKYIWYQSKRYRFPILKNIIANIQKIKKVIDTNCLVKAIVPKNKKYTFELTVRLSIY